MAKGDLVFFYHSNVGKEIVGVAKVVKTAYPDPTADGADWSVVELAPVKALAEPVGLATLKADASLGEMQVVRRSRISVTPVTKKEFDRVLSLGKTRL